MQADAAYDSHIKYGKVSFDGDNLPEPIAITLPSNNKDNEKQRTS